MEGGEVKEDEGGRERKVGRKLCFYVVLDVYFGVNLRLEILSEYVRGPLA